MEGLDSTITPLSNSKTRDRVGVGEKPHARGQGKFLPRVYQLHPKIYNTKSSYRWSTQSYSNYGGMFSGGL